MPPSRSSSFLLQIPSPGQIKAEHQIKLLDRTLTKTSTRRERSIDAERDGSDGSTTAGDGPGLFKRMTNNSLSVQQSIRKEITKQKYAKYGQRRYDANDPPPPDEDPSKAPQAGDVASASQKGYLEQAQSRAKAMLMRKRTLGQGIDHTDSVVDILYENQRGFFFFGVPRYSSNSLLPSDPRSWQNAQFRTSAVDIRNAQVPDPSWEWAWKSWYVDMSRDVDEEGWEYSFAFVGKGATTFAWHGNHPWFHSFVRRRRWLRMRKRRDVNLHRTKEKAHELTADYFTIHPKTMRPASISGRSATLATVLKKVEDPELNIEKMEINNMGDLHFALRHASLDREKLLAVRKFTDEGGDDLFYLGEDMPNIMSTFVFQSSRRQLLNDLTERHDRVHADKASLADHSHADDEAQQKEHDAAARRADNLLKAVHAADEQVRKLEYWSDVKGTSFQMPGAGEEGYGQPSFKNKQTAQEGAPELHKHAEEGDMSTSPSRKSSAWFDSQSQTSKGLDSSEDTGLERFVTPAESPSDVKEKSPPADKGKGKARALDDVIHELVDEEAPAGPAWSSSGHDMGVVAPVAEDEAGDVDAGG